VCATNVNGQISTANEKRPRKETNERDQGKRPMDKTDKKNPFVCHIPE